MVAAEVAHIDVERHGSHFGPGVHAEVGFGQQDGGGDTGGRVGHRRERMKQFAHRLKGGGQDGLAAPRAEPGGIGQPLGRAAASA